ncbi:MAG TPA: helix-turn-helix domain-containing protein [Mucilaginibacter sp.]|jgi:predicted DNA-binding transcriptional regulator AlpA|nr:helix-turn-helix domain-containing protein [Mucilaginibacter sp.]
MNNPFDTIDARLTNIECLLLSLKHPENRKTDDSQASDRCNFNDALAITGLSKSKLYKLSALGEVPCKRYGSRLVFSRKELSAWVDQQTRPKSNHRQVLLQLAASANKKGATR